MKRRSALKYLSTFATAVASLGIYTFRIEPKWVEFTNVDMKIPNIPSALRNKKLVQLSDIHIGPRFDWSYMKKAFKKVEEINPDFVVYTGDYVSYKNIDQLEELAIAAKYFPKGSKATLASLGNHDYGINWAQPKVAENITGILNDNGISVLANESKTVEGLTITGLEDYWGIRWNSDIAKTVLKRDAPQVVLCHNPDVCDLNIWGDFSGFILSGHTHGGQVKPPFLNAPQLPVKNKEYNQGYKKLDAKRSLYINRAIGCLWSVRFNVRPEVTVFTLK